MASSYCRNCSAKNATVAECYNNTCDDCEAARKTAADNFRKDNPTADESAALYAGRLALAQRATHPRQTFVNPSAFNRFDRKPS